MPYSPRTPDEIRQSLIAFLVSTGVVIPVDEGDVASTLLAAYSEDMASHEDRLLQFVNGHFFAVDGDLLDDRAAQVPGLSPRRLNAKAKGGSVRLRRSDSTTSVVFAPGELLIANSRIQDVTYTNRYPVTFPIGVLEVSGAHFVAIQGGASGNADVGTVNLVVRDQGLIFCRNDDRFTGGFDREKDGDFRARARAFVLTLARSQADAIVGLALNFTDSTGAGVLHAKAIQFADRQRGYTELVVSDGQGLPGSTRAGRETSGTFPDLIAGTRHTMYFDGPAATRLRIRIGGVEYLAPQSWLAVLEESGVAIAQETPPFVLPGVPWGISKHLVYQGWIAEFQDYVNRTCVAAGTRVRVMPPEVQSVNISANCIVASGQRGTASVFSSVRRAIVEFFEYIPPGEPAYIHKIHERVAKIPGVVNIIFDQRDLVPGSQRTKLVTNLSNIVLR
jgi:hypothetical protein